MFKYVQSFFARDFWQCSKIIGSLFVEALVHNMSFHIIINEPILNPIKNSHLPSHFFIYFFLIAGY